MNHHSTFSYSILIMLLYFVAFEARTQDIHFSQAQHYAPNLNPALTGANYDIQAGLITRQQWRSVGKPYSTMAGGGDVRITKFKTKHGVPAVGIAISGDKAGDYGVRTLDLRGTIAYRLNTGQNSGLVAGLYGGWIQRKVDLTSGRWDNQYDGSVYDAERASGETVAQQFGVPDVGAGLVYTYRRNERYMTGNDQRWLNAGVSVFHVNRPNYSYFETGERLAMRFSAHVTGLIGIPNSDIAIAPAVIWFSQKPASELLMGANVKYMLREESKYTGFVKSTSISLGAMYRNKDAVVLNLLFEYDNYALGVAYDINTSKLSAATQRRGGIEVFIRYVTPSPFSASKSRI